MAKKRVQSHVLEKVIFALMGVFGLAVILIFARSLLMEQMVSDVAMILILFIIVLVQLAQMVVLIKIYEQH